jgi:hypothetical protein
MTNVFNRAKSRILSGDLDLGSADLRILLLTSGYLYDPDDDFVADLTPGSNELTVIGYARQALAGLAVAEDDANDRAGAEADQVDFGALAAGETIATGIVYEFVTNDADSNLVAYYALGSVPS